MSELIRPIAEWCAGLLEFIGVAVIACFAVYVILYALVSVFKKVELNELFRNMRLQFGHGILLGLEFLVAADIIETVAVDLTLNSVSTLALVVLIRTFLSFTLEVELTGKWPWQPKDN